MRRQKEKIRGRLEEEPKPACSDSVSTEAALPDSVGPAFSIFSAFRHRLRLECICPCFSQIPGGNLSTKQRLDTLMALTTNGVYCQHAAITLSTWV